MAIHRKANNKFEVDIVDEKGKRLQKTFLKRTEANAFENSIKELKYKKKLLGLNLARERYPVEKALIDFKNTKQELRATSKKKYFAVIDEIGKFMKKNNIMYVDQFTPDHATILYQLLTTERIVNNSYTNRILKAKPKTVNFYLQTLRSFLRYELIKGHIQKQPTLHIQNLPVEKKKKEYYTEDELKAFFSQEMKPTDRNAFLGLLYTGTRFGELANLHWSDIDLHNRLIHIRSTELFRTKTYNSNRTIPMGEKLYILLSEISLNKISEEYPFCTTAGKQLRERRLLEKCKSYATAAGITSNSYLHKFRHTYASQLIQKGTAIQDIKELLGHWSVVETETYAHNKSDHLHAEVEKLDSLI